MYALNVYYVNQWPDTAEHDNAAVPEAAAAFPVLVGTSLVIAVPSSSLPPRTELSYGRAAGAQRRP
jgi:hypothetical protein